MSHAIAGLAFLWMPPSQKPRVFRTLRIVLTHGRVREGQLESADEHGVVLISGGRAESIGRASVRQLSLAQPVHRKRDVLLGFLLTGTTAAAVHCMGKSSACNEGGALYFYPFGAVGALAGFAYSERTAWRELYRAF